MATRIVIEVNGKTLSGELADSPAARRVAGAVPLAVTMSRWGDEYYGSTGFVIPEDTSARELNQPGRRPARPRRMR